MAITIVTKFLPCTDTRGARIKVSSSNGATKTYSYDYSSRDPHALAVWMFMNDVFDVNETTIRQASGDLLLPIAGLLLDNPSGWYVNSPTIDGKGYTVIIDSKPASKWRELY
ncbi:hypothetical protein [Providencia phage PSTRCR_120]|uniref:Uncharacterized protein n=1 Tax=Providencia phage PSTRCR_120 TaxID=2800826 RepID=A0A7T7CKW8_9CAUD|nr:hypothetical protein [Providencia phage PSTRCR_120]